jgi:hypothetical protein
MGTVFKAFSYSGDPQRSHLILPLSNHMVMDLHGDMPTLHAIRTLIQAVFDAGLANSKEIRVLFDKTLSNTGKPIVRGLVFPHSDNRNSTLPDIDQVLIKKFEVQFWFTKPFDQTARTKLIQLLSEKFDVQENRRPTPKF